MTPGSRASLTRFAWLSIAAAVATIALKGYAAWTTGSVGLFSDALESIVNLVAAILTLAMLTVAARPPDEEHVYGHGKAEYFSSGAEGALILIAAGSIAFAASERLLHPRPLERLDVGLVATAAASLVNFAVARVLLREGRRSRSIALEADARHLLSDVWTSAGVIAGVSAAAVTGWRPLDSRVALAVAALIVRSGLGLVRRSIEGLMDTALPSAERANIAEILARREPDGVRFHALRTRQSGARRFVSVHVLVPGEMSVQEGHDLVEEIEDELRAAFSDLAVFTHLEPLGDDRSMRDVDIDRRD